MFATLRARLPHIGRGPRLLVAATCVLLALSSAFGGGTGATHDARRKGTGLAAGLPAGVVAAAVTLDDPSGAELVHDGDRVDILESARPADLVEPDTAPVLGVATAVRHALVLQVLADRGDGTAALVLAVDRPTAVRLTRDRSTQVFTAVVVPP
jgi:hypothetical protein